MPAYHVVVGELNVGFAKKQPQGGVAHHGKEMKGSNNVGDVTQGNANVPEWVGAILPLVLLVVGEEHCELESNVEEKTNYIVARWVVGVAQVEAATQGHPARLRLEVGSKSKR